MPIKDHQKTVLVVDDDESSRHLYLEVFKKAGYLALAAKDGLEALDLASREKPDVIFTGIIMPRMDGFEMMRNLRKNINTSKIPVFVYSHLGREDDKRLAQELGAKDFIVRSVVSPQQVLDRVKLFMGNRQEYEITFDASDGDAARLARDFNFKPFFECKNGKRMKLYVTAEGFERTTPLFKAEFRCDE